jgi:DNA polymerase-3 subunit beta
MKVSINLNVLKAVAVAVSKEETRYYLCGVHLEAATDGLTMVATDGHRMLVARQPYGEHAAPEDFQSLIIPAGLIAKLKIKRNSDPWALLTIHGAKLTFEYRGETFGGDAVDGSFPDYRRVVPQELSGVVSHFNADYLAAFAEAGRVLFDTRDPIVSNPVIKHNGESPALAIWDKAEAPARMIGVIMPVRVPAALAEVGDYSWAYSYPAAPQAQAAA